MSNKRPLQDISRHVKKTKLDDEFDKFMEEVGSDMSPEKDEGSGVLPADGPLDEGSLENPEEAKLIEQLEKNKADRKTLEELKAIKQTRLMVIEYESDIESSDDSEDELDWRQKSVV